MNVNDIISGPGSQKHSQLAMVSRRATFSDNTSLIATFSTVIVLFYCLSNAMHGTEQIYQLSVSVCVCVCLKYLSSTIATAVFARSSSNLERD